MIEPKFAMIPSAVKSEPALPWDGKVYSFLPSDGSGDLLSGQNTYQVQARYNKDLLLKFESDPRLDWYAKKTCPTLLLEDQRTNKMLWSNDFTSGVWVKNGYDVSLSDEVAPDGNIYYKTANILSSTTNDPTRGVSQSVNRGTFDISYENFSIFVKRVEEFNPQVPLNNLVYFQATTFYGAEITLTWDFDNKTLVSNTGTQSQLDESSFKELPNGWFRIEGRFTMGNSYQTDWKISTEPFGSVIVWGAQYEFISNAFQPQREVMPSSYIPTTSAEITRGKNFCRNASLRPEIFDNPSGTLFIDLESVLENHLNTSFATIGLSKGSSFDDRVYISIRTDGFVYLIIRSSNIDQITNTFIDRNSRNKMAISWDNNYLRVCVNGVVISSGSNFYGSPIGLDSIKFNSSNSVAQGEFYGEIGDVRYYDSILSDADLIELTNI